MIGGTGNCRAPGICLPTEYKKAPDSAGA